MPIFINVVLVTPSLKDSRSLEKESPKLHLVGNLEETFLYQGDLRYQLLSWDWSARKMGS